MDIRVGHAGDFAAIMPMLRKHRAMHEQWDRALYGLGPDADARFPRWIGQVVQDPRTLLVVAMEQKKILGFVGVVMEAEVPIYECDQYALIHALWVEPEYRDHGVAAALIERAASECAAAGIKQLRIRTALADTQGRAMLEQAGFRTATIDLLRELPPGKT